MIKNITLKITFSLALTLVFGGISFLLAFGPGSFLVLPELALMAAILSMSALLLGGYYFCELESRKLPLLLVGFLAICISLPAVVTVLWVAAT